MMLRQSMLMLGLVTSLSVNAGVYQCKKGDVSAPCESSAWEVGGDALYLQPAAGAQNVQGIFTQINGNQTWNLAFNWGLRIEAGYHFGHGNDFNVNWSYYDQSQDLIDLTGNILNVGSTFNQNDVMSVLNFELGQHLDFAEKWDMRFHAGIQLDHIKSQLTGIGVGVVPGLGRTGLKWNMVGARTGLDSTYHIWDQLSFYGNGAFGLMYVNTIGIAPNLNTINNGGVSYDYNIGLKYTQAVTQGDITGRVGWTSYYWSINDNFVNVPSWQGLIFGAKWVGNA